MADSLFESMSKKSEIKVWVPIDIALILLTLCNYSAGNNQFQGFSLLQYIADKLFQHILT